MVLLYEVLRLWRRSAAARMFDARSASRPPGHAHRSAASESWRAPRRRIAAAVPSEARPRQSFAERELNRRSRLPAERVAARHWGTSCSVRGQRRTAPDHGEFFLAAPGSREFARSVLASGSPDRSQVDLVQAAKVRSASRCWRAPTSPDGPRASTWNKSASCDVGARQRDQTLRVPGDPPCRTGGAPAHQVEHAFHRRRIRAIGGPNATLLAAHRRGGLLLQSRPGLFLKSASDRRAA